MKVLPQEVYLHGLGKCPDYCYSIDFSWVPDGSLEQSYVVTGGADSVARVWRINSATFQLEIHSELTGHQLGVNCVRFSPDGFNSIATGSDDGKVVIWKHNTEMDRWVQAKILNVLDEVVCVAWSPCGTMIAAAVQREMTHVFNTSSGRLLARLDGHSNRVTGVCWDPLGQVIVSESSDRSVRVYSKKKNGSWYPKALLKDVISNEQETSISKWKFLISESHFPNDPTAHFFRRPDFCPDGSMVLIPGGLADGGSKFATLMFSRRCLVTGQGPSAVFTTPCAPSTAVRFHPRKFVSSSQQDENCFYVFVVTTVSSFYVMRSDRTRPIAFGSEIHCTAIVDAAWSSDAQILALCSTDGYVTLVKFDQGELGGVPDWNGFVKQDMVLETTQIAEKISITDTQSGMNTKRKITPIIVEEN